MTGVCETCGGRAWTLIDQEWRCVQCVTLLPFRRARRLQAEVKRLQAENERLRQALAGDAPPTGEE